MGRILSSSGGEEMTYAGGLLVQASGEGEGKSVGGWSGGFDGEGW